VSNCEKYGAECIFPVFLLPNLKCLALSILMMCLTHLHAQIVKVEGNIRTTDNEPLPDVVIKVSNTTQGTISGQEGQFRLKINANKQELSFSLFGYQTRKISLDLQRDTVLNITLAEQPTVLSTVYITPDGRDPAYAIIEEVKKRRDSLQKTAPRYTYKAYTKTRIELLNLAKFLNKRANLTTDTSEGKNILYLAENFSEVAFQYPDQVSETITASRVSGDKDNYSLFSSLFLRFDPYQAFIRLPGVSDRGFISPIADANFLYYDFKLIGNETLENQNVFQIAIIPKRKRDPVFSGTLWVVDSLFCLRGVDLLLAGNHQADRIDTLRIRQSAFPLPANKRIWKPVSVRFDFKGGPKQAKFGGYASSVFSEYDLKESYPPKTFTAEVLKVSEHATALPDSFWTNNRPTPLESKEVRNYDYKDSLEAVKSTPRYLDSLTKARAKPNITFFLEPYLYKNYRTDRYWRVAPLIETFHYNSMEGFVIALTVGRIWRPTPKQQWTIEPTLRYGFVSKRFDIQVKFQIQEGLTRKRRFYANNNIYEMTIGRNVRQFGDDQIEPLWNMVYSLVDGENFMKLYRQTHVRAMAQRELFNGFTGKIEFTYTHREPMPNVTWYSWTKRERFTENILFTKHSATIAELTLVYRIKNRYISTPDGRLNLGSKYPKIMFNYRKGIPIGGANWSDFDFISLDIKEWTTLRLLGNIRWSVGAGIFLNRSKVAFADYRHFQGNQTIWGTIKEFSIMNYYANSTNDRYIELHAEHYFGGFIFNKIPLVRKLKWQEIIGAHYLYTPLAGNYLETHIGIERILRVLRIDGHWRLAGHSYTNFGITLQLNLLQFFGGGRDDDDE